MRTSLVWLAPLAALVLVGWSASETVPPTARASATLQDPDPYVGNQMCVRCHEGVQEALTAVPHGSPDTASNLSSEGCQSCHGPGRLHVQRPADEQRLPQTSRQSFEEQNQLCTACHTDVPPFNETHALAQISCSGCHVFHRNDGTSLATLSWQPNCLSCHQGTKDFDALHEYDLEAMVSGEVSCTSCHPGAHQR